MWKFTRGDWQIVPEPHWEQINDSLDCPGFSSNIAFKLGNYAMEVMGWPSDHDDDGPYFVVIDFGLRLEPVICGDLPSLLIFLKEVVPILAEGWRMCDKLDREEAGEEI